MPDYGFTMNGYALYFTMKCIQEPMHAHLNDAKNKIEAGSAKIWVGNNGDTKVVHTGNIPDRIITEARKWIKNNHALMYKKWVKYGAKTGYYIGITKI